MNFLAGSPRESDSASGARAIDASENRATAERNEIDWIRPAISVVFDPAHQGDGPPDAR